MSMSGVRFEMRLGPISIWFAKYLRHGSSSTLQDSCNSWISYQYLYHVPWLTLAPRRGWIFQVWPENPHQWTGPGHGKYLSWTLDDLGLLILGCGHCLGTTMGQFKTLPHRAYFFNVKFHKWWSNNEQMQCTQSCTLSFGTILNISDKDLHS